MSDVHWSEDRVSTLKALWLEGLSASQIAAQLGGVTRNAVIGKVHRLGLSGRALPSAPPRGALTRTSQAPRRAAPRPKVRVRTGAAAEQTGSPMGGPGLASSLAELGAHLCKWPIGDPKSAAFTFCGRSASGPYCPIHAAQAYRPGTAWRAERDPLIRRLLTERAA